ncbi:cell cycle checkpoint control protein RAD9A [Engraulis encrasicolus]|uniref:cell cycle checkpoint control protein RAD9A n=1 Tax=Engraulis encrasicolus TaxID=184585 RepID=UPI002FD46A18
MDYVATGGNVKVLAKAIHSLSRIGDELYFEPQDDGLGLRTVNSSRSAFASFLLSPLFFQRFQTSPGHSFRCKMPIKSVQTVFKSLSSLEKTVEKCRIEWKPDKSQLTFTLHCKHGLLKTHNLSFQDCESLQAVFDRERCPNVIRAQPKLLVDTVLHFPPSLEEVTVSVSGDRMWLKNHVEDETDQSKAMMTELCLSSEEFDHFVVGLETSITFCLKELRGLLFFAESTGLPISIFFDEPGRPVVLTVSDSVMEANFVLATISEDTHQNNNKNNTKRCPTPPPADDFMCDDMDSYLIAMETSEIAGPSSQKEPQVTSATHAPPIPHHRLFLDSVAEEEQQQEDTDEDLERPASKKFRSLFFGSVSPTPSQQVPTQTTQDVLASDSEDEG